MTPEQWIKRYAHAWETSSTYEISCLFSPDASYRSFIFREPHVGREAIQLYWDETAGRQKEVKVRMGNPIVSGSGPSGSSRVAVEWWTTMVDPEKGPVSLPGVLLLKFTEEGMCRDLWEYWEVKKGMEEPPVGWGK
ncbi:hypothetical protein LOZ12_003053 [Ophidiomyces ophidiicola]|uniref:uncharacterized protein n=1 Tax=Ophidiomyces ophidiicola TaxID=1387563 RepID=UPI0020C240DB|nr:uncharacterized protein LOZ57_000462 [Ophidiomyces ophidiicola]KAI1947621.1 hypothetical protein LOZ62_002986 [Ophidiomyces ophidiicola]KAI1954114.1 hypothetical protein LOZ57_000462 [Ophidiomyces ophidiicola]KAI1957646.1 hypothetical protein LOZ59_003863 [Ophidiomyces ophidiicola]KAI1971327.1 hypothetical protein LOZ56_003147 [Ophidiomyces ophidiicola]KAI2006296.1 hypothetical protein LOZ50_003206 [Ophidiomyces ophidiicola]